jgi:hypothetical protein
MEGKATRLPFPPAENGDVAPLERIHCDVLYVDASDVGTPSHRGMIYVSTVLDQGTGVSLVALLQRKSQAAAHVQRSVAHLERQCSGGQKVKAIRFDRGGEYLSAELQGWLADRGIKVEPTAPYSPQQNGRAERLNRTLLDRTRCVLADSGLPLQFWCEGVEYVNWLRNRLLYAPIGMSPYEALLGYKPDLSKAHVFGSKVVYTVPKQQRSTKLDPTGQLGRFLGLDGGAYKVLPEEATTQVPGRQQIVLSRDVRFLESTDAVSSAAESSAAESAAEERITVSASSGSAAPVEAPQQQQAGSSTAGASGSGVLSSAVRLPVRRLGSVPELRAESPQSSPEPPAAEEVPAAGVRVSARATKGKSTRFADDTWCQLAGDPGDELWCGGVVADSPLSAFVSFR